MKCGISLKKPLAHALDSSWLDWGRAAKEKVHFMLKLSFSLKDALVVCGSVVPFRLIFLCQTSF